MRWALFPLVMAACIASGQFVPRRELLFRLDRERRSGHADPGLERLLFSGSRTVLFRDGRPYIPQVAPPSRVVRADLAVFGGELEAVTTAMAAAKRGVKIVLITDAPLGGLCSEHGGNLRYLDGIASIPRTPAQLELYRAIGVRGSVAVPEGVDRNIAAHLAREYGGHIGVLRTSSLNNLRVTRRGLIEEVVTEEGNRVVASRYLDMDPECRLGEQAGLEESIETPNIAYGLVFDLLHLRPADYMAMRSHERDTPEALLRWMGIAECPPRARASMARLERDLKSDVTRVYTNSSLGYKALADGFDFVMQCRSDVPKWLNERRICTGFNISHLSASANVNSLSYRLDDVVLQHAHSLSREARFRAIVTTELSGLADYFRYITGNTALRVRFPDQFYVRRPTAYFPTRYPYRAEEFTRTPRTKWWMAYSLDFRGLAPRDVYDEPLMRRIKANGYGMRRWDCRPSSCDTSIPNLFLLNKCSMTPEYSGGLRIVQNLVNTGQAWVESTYPLRKPSLRRSPLRSGESPVLR